MKRGAIAFLLILTFVFQGTTAVLAGTTGEISGIVVDASTNKPIAGVPVTASSASQVATTRTDQYGRFAFISLAPDTYTVTAAKTDSHDSGNVSAVTVQADQQITVSIPTSQTLQTIGRTTSKAQGALVKPGTIVDVYSVSAVTQDKASTLGGGGTLNSAWSALSSVPGVYVMPGQMGYIGAGASLSIRGGDYDQIGYEFDGVPVNRSFDDYPSGTLSSLGQQELQVYTGSNPTNSQASGLSGYINQVIRTGTAPAYKTLTLASGFPTYYGKLAFETGGANPSRTFSYYLGLGAYNQDFRYFDQFNGASLNQNYGVPLIGCGFVAVPTATTCIGPGGVDYSNGGATQAFALGPAQLAATHETQVRDTVFNTHFGIPKSDGTKDDVQVLLDIDHLRTTAYTSPNDIGTPAFLNDALSEFGTPFYFDGYQYAGKIGSVIDPTTAPGLVTPYLYPQSPVGRPFFGALDPAAEGGQANDQNIFKLQYQHNFGTNAFLRVYGYTYYSDWLMTDPTAAYSEYNLGTFGAFSPDYELSSHSRGASVEFSDQLNSQHLLTIVGNYVTANTIRDNNTEWLNGAYGPNSVNARTAMGVVVNAADPTAGYCFTSTGVATTCAYSGIPMGVPVPEYLTLQQAMAGNIPALPGACPLAGVASTTCEYLTVGNGEYATYNTVVPRFGAGSISDDWKPTDKLDINLSLREDQFQFVTSSQNDNAARQLYYNAFNMDNCFTFASVAVTQRPGGPNSACPAGTYAANVINQNGGTTTYDVIQPRAGLTYSLNPTTVLRASYGRYTQAPNSAFEQYDSLQSNQPYLLYNTYGFQAFGFNSSLHNVGPEISNNYDVSLEKSFGSDWSFKLTPFYRSTQDQIQQFFLSFISSFVSGLNVGEQTSKGFEFELDKGDFSRNGIAAKLSFAYTNSSIRYTDLATGATVLDPINQAIKGYNAYTSYCAANPGSSKCGATQSGVAAQCYAAGAPGSGTTVPAVGGACPAGSIANPYWNLGPQPLIDPSQSFATYDILAGPPGTNGNAYGAPYVSTLLVQYKHNRLAVTPALQLVAGQKYGTPETTLGIAPDLCGGTISGASNRYDVTTCGGSGGYYGNVGGFAIPIPNQETGQFDNLGAFTEPSLMLLHLQASYDVNRRITLVGTFSNLWHACFGGSSVPWKVTGACGYSPNNLYPVGNNYNPGDIIQPIEAHAYNPFFNSLPFNAYVEARIKI